MCLDPNPLSSHNLCLVLSKLYHYLVANPRRGRSEELDLNILHPNISHFLCRLLVMQSVCKGQTTPQNQTATCHSRTVQQGEIWVHVQRRIWRKINKPFTVGMSKSLTSPTESNVKLQVTVSSENQIKKKQTKLRMLKIRLNCCTECWSYSRAYNILPHSGD